MKVIQSVKLKKNESFLSEEALSSFLVPNLFKKESDTYELEDKMLKEMKIPYTIKNSDINVIRSQINIIGIAFKELHSKGLLSSKSIDVSIKLIRIQSLIDEIILHDGAVKKNIFIIFVNAFKNIVTNILTSLIAVVMSNTTLLNKNLLASVKCVDVLTEDAQLNIEDFLTKLDCTLGDILLYLGFINGNVCDLVNTNTIKTVDFDNVKIDKDLFVKLLVWNSTGDFTLISDKFSDIQKGVLYDRFIEDSVVQKELWTKISVGYYLKLRTVLAKTTMEIYEKLDTYYPELTEPED